MVVSGVACIDSCWILLQHNSPHAGAPLPWRDRIKLMGKSERRRQLKFDTERVWTFTIYQNIVRTIQYTLVTFGAVRAALCHGTAP